MKINEKVRAVGDTSVILHIFIENSASIGHGKTGLLFSTSGLIAWYKRNNSATPVQITLVTCSLGSFTSGGFKEISATHHPGWYELHVPDAVFASGANEAVISLTGASGIDDCAVNVQLGVPLTVASLAAILTQTATEAYAADGAAATVAQLLYMIYGCVSNYYVSSTTLSVTKLDNTTVAMTFTLNSASAPTSRLRAT